jgi:superfamily II DNA or RNA helicase/SAM-dependent methyltransferase/phage repressor protein C with HTH and peptisase S24 domain
MDETTAYYNQHAADFFANTVGVDMSPLYTRFLAKLPRGGSILDAGCGSGRDARAFADLGFRVTAFDASPELSRLATEHCGFDVSVRRFADVDEVEAYDGIWCCASLLHIPRAELAPQMDRLWRSLRSRGTFYVSFKQGDGDRVQNGRSFTDIDEAALTHLLRSMPGVETVETWITEDQRPGRPERWVNALATRVRAPSLRLVTGGADPFLPHVSRAFAHANDIEVAVAFVKVTGLRMLMPDLLAALEMSEGGRNTRCRVRILTSDYLDVTDPEALRLLLLLQERGAETKVFSTTDGGSFHLKAYLFTNTRQSHLQSGTAFIGSSNITRQALQGGLEWNYRVSFPGDPGFFEARQRFEELFVDPRSTILTDRWVDDYEQRRVQPLRPIAPGSNEREPVPTANPIQEQALDALATSRKNGVRRGLVVLATGLGKTWLAAFDSVAMGARRVLFVAHREEILSQAAETFLRIRPNSRVGLYMGKSRDAEVDVLCASVQTLARAQHMQRFSPQHFDYVVIDEFHHAAAGTYRRLLSHFAPSFLLGLTATPDRTDQSDILSLCDDNLVFNCGLFAGIGAKLLSPFHYYGILDESVDYGEIPWRNGRFDPEQLSTKLATLARARHALREWRQHAQQRTLAFCVSKRHADHMSEQFSKAGVASAAVYAGSTMGRAEALESLKAGRLRVIFSVDLFNEGVDLPEIDTVMMLRPTESKILFLQQLGRGLRRANGKEKLVVLDFIGNHQSFLHKPQALFQAGSTYKPLAEFARRAEEGRLELPEGCYVNFHLALIDFLKSLDSSGIAKDYEALRASLGRRPTLAEFYRSGASVQAARQQYGGWFQLVAKMGDLSEHEAQVMARHAALLHEIEVAAMTKSFKMVLLEAFLELDGLNVAPTIEALCERSWHVLQRRKPLLSDLPEAEFSREDGSSISWQRYWRANPINAWSGGNRVASKGSCFQVEHGRFNLLRSSDANDSIALNTMLPELVDYRLAAYEARQSQQTRSNVVSIPEQRGKGVELPYFPNLKIACGQFRPGRVDVDEYRLMPSRFGDLDPARHFIARASGNSMNGGDAPIRDGDYLLLEHLGIADFAGAADNVIAIEREDPPGADEQYLLRVVKKNAAGQYVLHAHNPDYADLPLAENMRARARLKAIIDPFDMALGKSFPREDIPALFGEEFNPGNWNAGHVVLKEKNAHVLLVTLNKQGKADLHRYHDYWVDRHTFHWQSQNNTTPASKKGQEIIEHLKRGIDIHLFVRETKLSAGKGAAFTYHGKVIYASHSGSKPMSIIFRV